MKYGRIVVIVVVAGLAAAGAAAQSLVLPSAPAGVQTFTEQGIQFARVQAVNVQPLATHQGNFQFPFNGGRRPIGGGTWDFGISRTEITQGQWIELVNAFGSVPVPAGQPWSIGLGAIFQGLGGVGPGVFARGFGPLGRPVLGVTPAGSIMPSNGQGWFGAALLSNWMHNNREVSLEAVTNGAYDLRGWDIDNPSTWAGVSRQPGARFWIPSYDEWAVASFYDPQRFGAGQAGWWPYLNGRDRLPIPGPPGVGETSAGWQPDDPNFTVFTMPVVSYPNSQSPWGMFDTSGTFVELLENQTPPQDPQNPVEASRLTAGIGAGPFFLPTDTIFEQPGWVGMESPGFSYGFGFRIATAPVPEPAGAGILLAAGIAMASRRRRT